MDWLNFMRPIVSFSFRSAMRTLKFIAAFIRRSLAKMRTFIAALTRRILPNDVDTDINDAFWNIELNAENQIRPQ